MYNSQQNETIPITCGIVNSIKYFMTKGKKVTWTNSEWVTKEAMISACIYTVSNKTGKQKLLVAISVGWRKIDVKMQVTADYCTLEPKKRLNWSGSMWSDFSIQMNLPVLILIREIY